MIICCVLGVILGIVFPIVLLVNQNKGTDWSDSSNCCGTFCHYLLRIGLIPLQIWALKLSGKEVGFYDSIAQRSCTTLEISSLFLNLEKDIRVAHIGNIISLAIFIFTTFIAICLFIKDNMKQRNQYENASVLSKYEPESQPYQNDYYSYPTKKDDYEQQYTPTPQTQQQQPMLYAPLGPTEETTFTSKPLFQPFNVNTY